MALKVGYESRCIIKMKNYNNIKKLHCAICWQIKRLTVTHRKETQSPFIADRYILYLRLFSIHSASTAGKLQSEKDCDFVYCSIAL